MIVLLMLSYRGARSIKSPNARMVVFDILNSISGVYVSPCVETHGREPPSLLLTFPRILHLSQHPTMSCSRFFLQRTLPESYH